MARSCRGERIIYSNYQLCDPFVKGEVEHQGITFIIRQHLNGFLKKKKIYIASPKKQHIAVKAHGWQDFKGVEVTLKKETMVSQSEDADIIIQFSPFSEVNIT